MTNVKVEDDEKLPLGNMYPWQIGDNVASSSSSHVRLSFIEMGFPPSLVDKAIEENGEDNEDMLLDTLTKYSAPGSMKSGALLSEDNEPSAVRQPREAAPQISCAESSDSLDSLFGEKNDASNHIDFPADINLKEEPYVSIGVRADKRASLLMMNFSMDEVDYAIDKLGEDAPISDVVDFISAAQIAETNVDCANYCDEVRNEDSSTETLFGTLNNTLLLLDMGFSEKEISAAIDVCGSEASAAELADSIVSGQINKYTSTSSILKRSMHVETCRSFSGVNGQGSICFDELPVKTEEYNPAVSQSSAIGVVDKFKGKRQNEGSIDNSSCSKRPKEEYDDALSSVLPPWLEPGQGMIKLSELPISRSRGKELKLTRNSPSLPKPNSCRILDKMVAKPPYFFYGNVMNLSCDSWNKISQFLYAVEPEFVNTRSFSALSRKEGYVHNLPTDDRFYIIPKSPKTIGDAIPSTKKWWPSWDTREQISCINVDTSGISQQRERLEKILIDSGGLLSVEQQRDLLHRCKLFNLVWVGNNKLRTIGPEHLERILGYPIGHTEVGLGHTDRLQSLEHCFQIDTLGYHLSVLRTLFPDGLTLLSIYSGVGGSEITLDRLGICLKGVVSVEPCETKRRILKQWWSNSGQSGELVQIEDILKLSSSKLETLKTKFGGFDFIICQAPNTYDAKCPVVVEDKDNFACLDFPLFFEFVRILQRVR